ncbi:uncharacterized protein F5Z01DRAFT_636300 [Emericellopsis atlantica]|uniref:Uncharacterized protein n=1 Tax=Emericellopsis atlantica TaxID=2614577 RepID=A0A9P8CPG1_9HYPO|nr:uncharacterized protein F5Z01DRAFT_636300 [Emericellopsis atlantica]KAG9254834.1 hypothetical protein F5Z01DRAFT_636300 [Emericellopsis atlantica]
MKTSFAIAALTAIAGASAASTTITCNGACPSSTPTNDMVTREPVPTFNCTAPALSIISSAKTDSGMASGTGGMMPTPTSVPGGGVPGAADKVAGGFAGVAVAAMVAAYVL